MKIMKNVLFIIHNRKKGSKMKSKLTSAAIAIAVTVALLPITAIAKADRYQELASAPFKNDYPTAEATRMSQSAFTAKRLLVWPRVR